MMFETQICYLDLTRLLHSGPVLRFQGPGQNKNSGLFLIFFIYKNEMMKNKYFKYTHLQYSYKNINVYILPSNFLGVFLEAKSVITKSISISSNNFFSIPDHK